MVSIVEIIMRRDNISRDAAIERIKDAQAQLLEFLDGQQTVDVMDAYEEAADVLRDAIGLDPDYLFDVIDFVDDRC
ncbi:MAG: hypothetical protein IJ421_00025 [Prevotella sp.]|nr:hypothetical protein [Prevotella sp.]